MVPAPPAVCVPLWVSNYLSPRIAKHLKRYHSHPTILVKPVKTNTDLFPHKTLLLVASSEQHTLLPNIIQPSIYFQRYSKYQSLCSSETKNKRAATTTKMITFLVGDIHSTLTQLYATFWGVSIFKIPRLPIFLFFSTLHSQVSGNHLKPVLANLVGLLIHVTGKKKNMFWNPRIPLQLWVCTHSCSPPTT